MIQSAQERDTASYLCQVIKVVMMMNLMMIMMVMNLMIIVMKKVSDDKCLCLGIEFRHNYHTQGVKNASAIANTQF